MPFDIARDGGRGILGWKRRSMSCGIPFGAAVGHTFKLDNGNAAHAVRASAAFDRPLFGRLRARTSGRGNAQRKLDVDVDIGVNYEITPQVAVRARGAAGRDIVCRLDERDWILGRVDAEEADINDAD